jgi:hypothetical protein
MFFFLSNILLCWLMIMRKLDEIRARLDWLKEQFKILVTILVADVAGVSKLYIDTQVDLLFYSGLVLLVVLTRRICARNPPQTQRLTIGDRRSQ